MTFEDKLEKVCPKCSEATKLVYLQNIRRLYRFKDNGGEIPSSSSSWLESSAVLKQYKALPFNIRRALSVAGLKASRAYGISTDKWYARMLDDQNKYRKNRAKNKRTDAEDAKMLEGGVKELKKITSEYKRQINRELREPPTLKSLYKYQMYLSLRMFVDLPFRNDFPTFELQENKTGNYIRYKKRKLVTFIIRKYKNSDRLGPREVEVSAALSRVIKQFIKFRNQIDIKHDYLLSNVNGDPMSKQAFSKAIHSITRKLSGRSFGSRIMRVLHATENASIIEQSAQLTHKLLHTASQTRQYVKHK